VKYVDQLVIVAKEEAVLQGNIERLTANWKMLWNGNKSGKKTKMMRISRQLIWQIKNSRRMWNISTILEVW